MGGSDIFRSYSDTTPVPLFVHSLAFQDLRQLALLLTMKHRFWLFRRHGVFYIQDSRTRHKESLHTRDATEARRLRDARNTAADQPSIGIALAKAYLSARDAKIGERSWQDVIDEFCSHGKPQTQTHRREVTSRKPFDLIRRRKLIETVPDDILAALKAGGVMTSAYLRCLHNLATGLGWLPWPVLPSRLWPSPKTKAKRGVLLEEHQRIIDAEKNPERRLYYELLWETGASQSDAACLRAENIDWKSRLLIYERQKTGQPARLRIGDRLAELLRQLPGRGPLFPRISASTNNARAAEFSRRCALLRISGISLHSYRYAWAQRARTAGMPERFAQEALGHGSKAVHRAYAHNACVNIPSIEEYEKPR